MEMVAAIVHQLTRNLTDEQVQADPGFAAYFVDHTAGVYPTAASGFPWSAASIQSTGDVIADLSEDLAADAASSFAQHLFFIQKNTAQKMDHRLKCRRYPLIPMIQKLLPQLRLEMIQAQPHDPTIVYRILGNIIRKK